jgi:hypothetical protein
MGALGEYPEDQMLSMLQNEVKKWSKADTTFPCYSCFALYRGNRTR